MYCCTPLWLRVLTFKGIESDQVLIIISEALDVIKEEHTMPAQKKRNKRDVPFTHDEKRIAGVSTMNNILQ